MSWIDEGVTPSWVVYPVVLLIGLWRLRRGKGFVVLGAAALVFVLVHLPFSLAWLFGGENPYDADREYSPLQWVLTLLVAPGALLVASALAWREERRGAAGTLAV